MFNGLTENDVIGILEVVNDYTVQGEGITLDELMDNAHMIEYFNAEMDEFGVTPDEVGTPILDDGMFFAIEDFGS